LAAQAVSVRLYDEMEREVWTGVVDGKRDVSLPAPGGSLLRIVVERLPGHVLQDFHVRALDGVVPIAAPSPAGLLNLKEPSPARPVSRLRHMYGANHLSDA
jgi:hypothetical protein